MGGFSVFAFHQRHGFIIQSTAANRFGQVGGEKTHLFRALLYLAAKLNRHLTGAVHLFFMRVNFRL